MDADLPFVDEHALTVPQEPDVVWPALLAYVDRTLASPGSVLRRLLTTVLGTDPPAGFDPVVDVPGQRLRLTGRHRFSRYALVFEVVPDGTGSRLSASTFAAFPGWHGRAYRAAVIGSGAHAVLTRRMVREVAQRC